MYFKKIKFFFFSNNRNIIGTYTPHQPAVFRGKGKIEFGDNVAFGVIDSPYFLNTYSYIEARNHSSLITFGNNVSINNNFSVISEMKIVIGDNVLIGFNCQIMDSNFHDLNPANRKNTDPSPEEIIIKNNAFIGNNVTILKGVTIGENVVVASGSIVTKSFKDNVVIAGVPASVISQL